MIRSMYSFAGPSQGQVGLQELQEAADGGERRADLVGDARRHASEQGELIGPPDLVADALLLRGVAEEQHDRRRCRSPLAMLDRHLQAAAPDRSALVADTSLM